ncbi:hypothetical protein CHISP_3754 [Chitinispirillum alkaliphilum]|nr:hypothetical protein CHISP_3754 [Chitinispirillum alkaliphilum]
MLTDNQKRYSSASQRFIRAALNRFFKENIPLLGGNELRDFAVEKVIEVFESFTRKQNVIKPGQLLWVAVDKNTRPDSKNVVFKPVVLTLID